MAVSNTNSLSTNFNVDPYYDDFDEAKNFYRILYRPGQAVQARELTQMQTMLQNQVDRFGEHIFREGSTVRGMELSLDKQYRFVKLRDNSANGSSVLVTDFLNKVVTGTTNKLTANVVAVETGSEAATPNYKTLFVKYTSANGTISTFANGEQLTTATGKSANLISSGAFGRGSAITIREGIIYAKDHFIRFPSQTMILDKYSSLPNYKVGCNVVESVVASTVDSTLLDPAQGAYNYAAPGADRLKLLPVLKKLSLDYIAANNFIEFTRIVNGKLQSEGTKPQYAQLRDYIAKRTYDESGNYVVKGMTQTLGEHLLSADGCNGGLYTAANGGNNDLLICRTAPGNAYIRGYDNRTLVTINNDVRKGLDYKQVTDVPVSTNYGNYTTVKNLVGNWPILDHAQVSLRDTVANAVSNSNFSTTTAVGAEIGTARVRHVAYYSGTKGSSEAQYYVYLYDIKMASSPFTSVRSIYYDQGSTADAKADLVLTGGNATLSDTTFNRSIFKTGSENVKSVRASGGSVDLDFNFNAQFDATIATDGTFTLTPAESGVQYPYTTGALNTTQKRGGFHVVLNAQANSASTLAGTVSIGSGANTVTGSGTGFTSRINIGDQLLLTGLAARFEVTAVTNDTSLTVLQNAGGTLSGVTYKKDYPVGHVIDMAGVGGDAAARSITVDSTTQSSFDIQETLTSTASATVYAEMKKVNGREMAKQLKSGRYVQIQISNNAGGTSGPWDLGLSDIYRFTEVRTNSASFTANTDGTDYSKQFHLDMGQRDNFYDHGRLFLKGTSTLSIGASDYILVKMDYFTHSTTSGVGYFTVDSYPIDDVLHANTNAIQTKEIPIFTSPTDGVAFDLRNCIDTRPRILDSATDTTVLGSATLNPSPRYTMIEPSYGIHYPTPNDEWNVSLSFYLKRRDLAVLDIGGLIRVIEGIPHETHPQNPPEPDDTMVLAVLDITPYPSLSQEGARHSVGCGLLRSDLACKITNLNNRRYTMRDIGDIVKRVEKVEYYTALSLLEKDASDMLIADSSGNNRFKNGILVDNFTGHKVGNVYDPCYAIAIDPKKGEARPKFELQQTELQYYSANSTNIQIAPRDVVLSIANSQPAFSNGETITAGAASGKLVYKVDNKLYIETVSGTFVASATASGGTSSHSSTIEGVRIIPAGELLTLPYTHTKIITQPYASTTRNPAGLLLSYQGVVKLDPDNDIWVDTTAQPDVLVDMDMNQDNWRQLADAWGTQFGDWKSEWMGAPSISSQSTTSTSFNSQGDQVNTIQTQTTTTTQEGQTRDGLRAEVTGTMSTEARLGSKLVSVNIQPFMRARTLNVTGHGFKPNTRLFFFFDDQGIGPCIMPTNSSFANTGGENSEVRSDTNGTFYATFRIPNSNDLPGGHSELGMRFRTGSKIFRVTDSITNNRSLGATTTWAETTYTASGLHETTQDTVISTRPVQINFESTSQSRTITDSVQNTTFSTQIIPSPQAGGDDGDGDGGDGDGDGGDPMAQSFRLDMGSLYTREGATGGFLTKIDLFFASKPSAAPVFIEIREVDPNGYQLTNRTVPFSNIRLLPEDMNTSPDGTKPTPVYFSTPVYLQHNMDYAIVIIDRIGDTNVWVSKIGEIDIDTGTRIVKQPFMGVMYASSNNKTWQQIQEEDVKLNMYVADFDTAVTGTAIVKNEPRDFFSVANTSGSMARIREQYWGESTIGCGTSPSINVGTYAVGGTSTANGYVTYVSGSTIRTKLITPLATPYSTGETITFKHANGLTTGVTTTVSTESTPKGLVTYYDNRTSELGNTFIHLANTSGTFVANTWIKGQWDGESARILDIQNLTCHIVHPKIEKMILRGTTLTSKSRFATSTSARESSYVDMPLDEDSTFDTTKYVLSRSNEHSGLSSVQSCEMQLTLNTTNRFVSPVIDTKKMGMTTVENLINNSAENEANTVGGDSTARYISRIVELADGQDGDDIRLILTGYRPSTSRIHAYYKILHADDSDTLDDRYWIAMSPVSGTSGSNYSSQENRDHYIEYEYSIPTANMTGAGDEVQYTNSSSVTFTGFKKFQVKLVLVTSQPSNPPRVKDLRVIALQV